MFYDDEEGIDIRVDEQEQPEGEVEQPEKAE